MFTGLITDQGHILSVTPRDQGRLLRIATHYEVSTIPIGASIACHGVCLSVTAVSTGSEPHWFEVEAWAEALARTNIIDWTVGTIINLERSLKMGDELGGHMVSGHVDGTAEIVESYNEGQARRFVLQAPSDLMKFIVPKGSLALDGTSLTVNAVEGARFDVLLIHHSLMVTTWGRARVGDRVNIEVDSMARYVFNLLERQQKINHLE